jgi:hypothetical protein
MDWIEQLVMSLNALIGASQDESPRPHKEMKNA